VDLAKSSRERDWSVEVGYSQRRPNFDNMISVVVAIDLPFSKEKRQDRDVASKLAEAEQARAQHEDALRMHEAEVKGLLADWNTAGKRLERYDSVLLPLARERAQAALAAYRGGRGEVAGVLEADRALAETELARIQSETERARAWAGLNYMYGSGGES
jgi:outer membrane protein TolC